MKKIICSIIIEASLVVVEVVDLPVVVVVGLGVVGLGVVGLGVVVVMDSNYTKNEISRFGILHLLIKYRNKEGNNWPPEYVPEYPPR